MQSQSIRLILVRHGEVDANRHFRYLGRRDDELNSRGIEQAGAVATALEEIAFDGVISSPLLRAATTARMVAAAAGLQVLTDARLIELDFGGWEGRSRSEIIDEDAANREAIERWESDPTSAPPGGESLVDLQSRVVDLADGLAVEQPGATIVTVSHMGPIKVLLCAALNLGLEDARRVFLDPAAISVIDWGPRPIVRLVNSHAHLGFSKARWLEDR